MELVEIQHHLQTFTHTFPRQVLQAAIAHREEITPWLLQVVSDTRQRAQELLDQPQAMAHIYAPYLLAQFREQQAYPLMIDLFSLPGDITLDLTGDLVIDDTIAEMQGWACFRPTPPRKKSRRPSLSYNAIKAMRAPGQRTVTAAKIGS